MPTEYQYQPLDPSRSQIRLLSIVPNEVFSSEIQCKILTISLFDSPQYEALSYVWGASEATRHVSIEGKRLWVTLNCHEALRQLRTTSDERVIWVDAICINQQDISERNSQIVLMVEIYRTARQVAVWLGLDRGGDNFAFKVVEKIANIPKVKDDFEAFYAEVMNTEHVRQYWQSLAQLMEHTWWSRLWTHQEIAFASDVKLYHGENSIPWKWLQLTLDTIDAHHQTYHKWSYPGKIQDYWGFLNSIDRERSRFRFSHRDSERSRRELLILGAEFERGGLKFSSGATHENDVESEEEDASEREGEDATTEYQEEVAETTRSEADATINDFNLKQFEQLVRESKVYTGSSEDPVTFWATRYHSAQNYSEKTILKYLRVFSQYDCTDPRDHIFAIMTFSNRENKSLLIKAPDYHTPVDMVYLTAALSEIQTSKRADLVRHAGLGAVRKDVLFNLPSWVPDWRHVQGSKIELAHGIFQAGWKSHTTCGYSEDLRELRLGGDFADTIESCIPILNMGRQYMEFYREASVHDRNGEVYPNGQNQRHALVRTVFSDTNLSPDLENHRLSDDLVDQYVALSDSNTWHDLGPPEQPFDVNTPLGTRRLTELTFALTRFHLEAAARQCLFRTRAGYIGTASAAATAGDMICIFLGCEVPLLLRRVDDHYVLIGECFVWGMMDGEVFINRPDKNFEIFRIR